MQTAAQVEEAKRKAQAEIGRVDILCSARRIPPSDALAFGLNCRCAEQLKRAHAAALAELQKESEAELKVPFQFIRTPIPAGLL